MLLPTQDSPQCFYNHALDRRKLLIHSGSILIKICFPQQQKGVKEAMIFLIKIQSVKMKMT